MISTKAKTYCCEDISKIDNYDKAAIDPHRAWKVYHRNLITGIGRIPWRSLKSIGKYYKVPAKELVFLPKSEVRELEARVPMTDVETHGLTMVLKFWIKLNPDKRFSEFNKEEYERIYRSVRRLRILWNQMKARCYNENAQDYPFYGALGIRMCREWLSSSDNFVMWSLKNGYTYYPDKAKGDQLSIDRINPKRNYQPSNCRWIPQRQNCARTRPVDWDFVLDRAYQFAKMFPLAADICYGRARINWKKARDIYMGGDTSRLVKFLKDNCYCSMAIWRIRKALGDVIPQRKSERGEA